MKEIMDRIRQCIPSNPYPEDIFPMSTEDYVRVLPDPIVRTAVSGCMGRWAYDMAARMILDAIEKEFEEELEAV